MSRLTAAALAAALMAAAGGPARAQEEGAGDDTAAQLRMGGFMLFGNTRAPLSLVTLPARPKDAIDIGEVQGSSCQHGVSIPLGLSLRRNSVSGQAGNGGYEKALARARDKYPGLRGIYDVRVDVRQLSILGIYRKLCVELVARGFR